MFCGPKNNLFGPWDLVYGSQRESAQGVGVRVRQPVGTQCLTPDLFFAVDTNHRITHPFMATPLLAYAFFKLQKCKHKQSGWTLCIFWGDVYPIQLFIGYLP